MPGIFAWLDGIIGVQSALGGRGGGIRYPLSDGLLFWLNAADITTLFQDSTATTPVTDDGQEVGAWVDGVTLTAKGTQATATKLPLYKTGIQNGLPGILFDGSNDFLAIPDLAIDGAVTVIAVLNTVAAGAYNIPLVLSRNSSNVYYLWLAQTSTTMVGSIFDTAERGVSFTASPVGTNIVALTNVEGSPVSFWRDGIEKVGSVNTGTFGAQGASRLGIWRDSTNYAFGGYVCELLVYDRVLSASEMAGTMQHLGAKWGVSTTTTSAAAPLGIADNVFWFDASRIPANDGDTIFVLPDRSGNGYHAIQQNLTLQGLFKDNVQNGLPAILMDATDDYYVLVNQDIVINDELSVFGVFKIADHASSSPPMLLALTNITSGRDFVMELFYDPPSGTPGGDVFFPTVYADATTYDPRSVASPIGAHVFGATEKEGGSVVTYLDSAAGVAEAITGTFEHGAYSTTNAKLGSNIDGLSRWMNGYICELMLFSRVLTTDERTALIAYLTDKWGIV